MLYFRGIDLSGNGPFDSGQSLRFSNGLTVVGEGDGTGNATIIRALRVIREGEGTSVSSENCVQIPSWIVFFDRDARLRIPYGGDPWTPLVQLMSSQGELKSKRKLFEEELTSSIRAMLNAKIDGGISKFSSEITSPNQLHATLTEEGAVIIIGNDGNDISGYFQALSERVVLYLSINAAVRKLLSIDAPFVADSLLGLLDESLLHTCYDFILHLGSQQVIIESDLILGKLRMKPHYLVAPHPVTKRLLIEKQPSLTNSV